MIIKSLMFTALLMVTLAAGLTPVGAQARGPIDLPVDMDVPITPTPFKADGKTHLVYELHLTNFSSTELMLARVEVLAASGATQLAQYEGTELNARIARPGLPQTNLEKQRLGGGMRAILYVWITVDQQTAVPVVLRHRITASLSVPPGAAGGEAAKTEPIEVKGEGAEITVNAATAVVISPPLRGGEWLAANGPGNASGHRRALIPIAGKAHIAQRFAIDWYNFAKTVRPIPAIC
jgi:murein DD-endopeptidase